MNLLRKKKIFFFQFINYLLFSYHLIYLLSIVNKVITEDEPNLREKYFFSISCLLAIS